MPIWSTTTNFIIKKNGKCVWRTKDYIGKRNVFLLKKLSLILKVTDSLNYPRNVGSLEVEWNTFHWLLANNFFCRFRFFGVIDSHFQLFYILREITNEIQLGKKNSWYCLSSNKTMKSNSHKNKQVTNSFKIPFSNIRN